MQESQPDHLTISIEGGWAVYRYRDLLTAIDYAYNYMYVGTLFLDGTPLHRRSFDVFFAEESRRFGRYVPMHDRLIFEAAEFHSPGFISLKGSGEILKQIRLYFQDRHKRRQDREIREPAEKRQLELQNTLRESEVLSRHVEIARECGIPEEEIRQIVRRMFAIPLMRLDQFQSQGLIRDSYELDRSFAEGRRIRVSEDNPTRMIELPNEDEK